MWLILSTFLQPPNRFSNHVDGGDISRNLNVSQMCETLFLKAIEGPNKWCAHNVVAMPQSEIAALNVGLTNVFCLKDCKALVLLKPNLQLGFFYLKNTVLAALFCVEIHKF